LEERIVDLMTSNSELLGQNARLLERLVGSSSGSLEPRDGPGSGLAR